MLPDIITRNFLLNLDKDVNKHMIKLTRDRMFKHLIEEHEDIFKPFLLDLIYLNNKDYNIIFKNTELPLKNLRNIKRLLILIF